MGVEEWFRESRIRQRALLSDRSIQSLCRFIAHGRPFYALCIPIGILLTVLAATSQTPALVIFNVVWTLLASGLFVLAQRLRRRGY